MINFIGIIFIILFLIIVSFSFFYIFKTSNLLNVFKTIWRKPESKKDIYTNIRMVALIICSCLPVFFHYVYFSILNTVNNLSGYLNILSAALFIFATPALILLMFSGKKKISLLAVYLIISISLYGTVIGEYYAQTMNKN